MKTVCRDRSGGFSLVEVLVAVAVAGMVVLGAARLTGLARDAQARSERETSARDQIIAADRIFLDVITGSVPELGAREASAPGATSVRLKVLTTGSAIMAFDRPLPVTLTVRDRAEGAKALIVTWLDLGSNVETQEIAIDGARAISFAYFGADIGRSAVWRSEWPYAARLPLAVSLRVDYPALGPPVHLLARTIARYPEVCIALPQEPACYREPGRVSESAE